MKTRLQRQYELGRTAYEKGDRYSHYASIDWQRGFKDARDEGALSGRVRIVIGASDPGLAGKPTREPPTS